MIAWASRAPTCARVCRKRDTLTRYPEEHSLRTGPKTSTFGGKQCHNLKCWHKVRGLLSYFPIDVEMGACMLTSRIKQAISSVQMPVRLLGRPGQGKHLPADNDHGLPHPRSSLPVFCCDSGARVP